MEFDPEVIGPSSEKWSRAGRYIHKCAIDISSEVGFLEGALVMCLLMKVISALWIKSEFPF